MGSSEEDGRVYVLTSPVNGNHELDGFLTQAQAIALELLVTVRRTC